MKVLICHNYYNYKGGEEYVVENDIKLLEENGFEVIKYLKENQNNFITFINFFFSLKTYFEIKNIIKKEKPDVAHIHNIFPSISPSIYYILKKYNIPIVQTIHNYRFYCSNGLSLKNGKVCNKCEVFSIKNIFNICRKDKKLYDFLLGINIFLMRLFKVFDKVDYFLAPSLFIKEKMVNSGIREKKIIIKRNFLESNLAADYNKKDASSNNYFVFVGRFSKEKGVLSLIRVFKDLSKINLKILGDGPLRNDIINFIKVNDLKNIELLGYIDGSSKYKILENATATIIPSVCYENCPITLIESLALGTPIIANDIGAIPEFIKDNYNGFIYHDNNEEMLKSLILKLSQLDNKDILKLRDNCIEIYKQLFDKNVNFEIVRKLYFHLVQG